MQRLSESSDLTYLTTADSFYIKSINHNNPRYIQLNIEVLINLELAIDLFKHDLAEVIYHYNKSLKFYVDSYYVKTQLTNEQLKEFNPFIIR